MTKKKSYLLLSFIIVFFNTTGCSIILRKNFPAVETLPTGWSQIQDERGGYGFKYKDVSTRLSASYRPAFRVMWFGPPLIPFIPKFLFAPKDILGELKLYIRIESPTDTSGLEVTQIQAFGAGEKALQVDIKSVYLRFGSEKPKELKEIPKQLTISNGELFFYLECHSTLTELKRFTIDLGSLNVGDEKIKLVPLNFLKKSKYVYGPFVFSNHLEDHYP